MVPSRESKQISKVLGILRWCAAGFFLFFLVNPSLPEYLFIAGRSLDYYQRSIWFWSTFRIAGLVLTLSLILLQRRIYFSDLRAFFARLEDSDRWRCEKSPSFSRRQVWIAASIFALFAANLLYLWFILPAEKSIDGPSYETPALHLLRHHNFAGHLFRTPGYPLFLTLFIGKGQAVNLEALAFVQTFLLFASALIFAIGLCSRLHFSPVFASVFAVLFFSQFHLIAMAQLEATAILALFLGTTATLTFLADFERLEVRWPTIVASFSATALALTRPSFFYFPVLIFIGYLAFSHWKKGLVFVLFPALVLGGWLVRNYVSYGLMGPASSVHMGLTEQVLNHDFYRYVDFGNEAEPQSVRALTETAQGSDDNDKRAKLYKIIQSATANAVRADPWKKEALRIRYLRRLLRSGLRTANGLRIFQKTFFASLGKNLGVGTGYWQSNAAIHLNREYPTFFRLSHYGVELIFARYNPIFFGFATLFTIVLFIRFVMNKNRSRPELLSLFLWSVLATNTILCSLFDIPISARYNIGVLPLFPFLYMAQTIVLVSMIRSRHPSLMNCPSLKFSVDRISE